MSVLFGVIIVSFYPSVFATSLRAPSIKIFAAAVLESNPVVQQLLFFRQFFREQLLAFRIANVCNMVAGCDGYLFHLLLITDEVVRQVVRCIPEIVKTITGLGITCPLV